MPYSGKSRALWIPTEQMGKPKHCPHVLTGLSIDCVLRAFWRINKSYFSTEILDNASPQFYSLEGTSNYFSQKEPMHFLDLLLKSDPNAYKSGQKSL